jgi:hypothetical protein
MQKSKHLIIASEGKVPPQLTPPMYSMSLYSTLTSSEPLLRSLRRFDGDLVEHRRRRHGPTPSTNPSTPLISISLFNRGTGKYGIVDRHRGLWSHATQTRAAPPARPPPSTLNVPTAYIIFGSWFLLTWPRFWGASVPARPRTKTSRMHGHLCVIPEIFALLGAASELPGKNSRGQISRS